MKSTYTLKAINNDIAIISAEGKITCDNSSSKVMGMSDATADLAGEQEGEFEMETKTGMLISCRMRANVKGTLRVMGREIPVIIKTSLKTNGHKL